MKRWQLLLQDRKADLKYSQKLNPRCVSPFITSLVLHKCFPPHFEDLVFLFDNLKNVLLIHFLSSTNLEICFRAQRMGIFGLLDCVFMDRHDAGTSSYYRNRNCRLQQSYEICDIRCQCTGEAFSNAWDFSKLLRNEAQ